MSRPFHLLGVDHTGITVRDLEAAIDLWCGCLGFELLYRGRRDGTFATQVTGVPGADILIAVLQGPGHRIELLQYAAPTDRDTLRPRPCDLGSVHVALYVDDLDTAAEALVARGWVRAGTPQTIDVGPTAGKRLVYLADAEGTTIELMQPPPPAPTNGTRSRALPARTEVPQ